MSRLLPQSQSQMIDRTVLAQLGTIRLRSRPSAMTTGIVAAFATAASVTSPIALGLQRAYLSGGGSGGGTQDRNSSKSEAVTDSGVSNPVSSLVRSLHVCMCMRLLCTRALALQR